MGSPPDPSVKMDRAPAKPNAAAMKNNETALEEYAFSESVMDNSRVDDPDKVLDQAAKRAARSAQT